MAQRSIFDQPTTPRLFNLIEKVRQGLIEIPAFQRPFEWDKDRRLLLFDSVSKGIPIGSFLIWITRDHTLETYTQLGGYTLRDMASAGVRTYLLDGHQRLSTLFAALNWGSEPSTEDSDGGWPIWFNTRAEPNALAFASHKRRVEPPPEFVPLSIMLQSRKLWEYTSRMRSAGLHEEAERAEELANTLKDYQIPMVPLVSEDLDLVTDSFVRINRHGKAMQESHMLHALAFPKSKTVRVRMEDLKERLHDVGWGEIDEKYLVNALKIRWDLDVYSAGPRKLMERFEAMEGTADEAL
ncbi:MAG: DUF262 domain-containing protein, partial [Myxococcota bacterium]